MRRLTLAAAVAVGTIAAASYASAAPIAAGSTLNIIGAATFSATQVTVTEAGTEANNGSFAPLGSCLTCATLDQNPYTFAPTPSLGLVFTVTNNGDTATVTLGPGVTVQEPVTGILDIEDNNASLTMTGFSTTPGRFNWTINQETGGVSGSFSATAVATPEPASLVLLGAGLLGLGVVGLRRRR